MSELEINLIFVIVLMLVFLLMYVLIRQYERIQAIERDIKFLFRDTESNAKHILGLSDEYAEMISECKNKCE
tara:strand:+ start:411 stop:626 length:216 start_codon:yes stop_codon:yes gene_type:complete